MSANEKATELVLKFSSLLPFYSEKDNLMESKICALTTVNEIIKEFEYNSLKDEMQGYWQQVIKEIKLL